MRIVVDSDAWLCLRHMGFLARLLGQPLAQIAAGEYAARHELGNLESEWQTEVNCGHLVLLPILAKDPVYRRLLKARVDKGEAGALAAMLAEPTDRDVFVSNDRKARDWAKREGVNQWDALDAMIWMLEQNLVTETDLRTALGPWDDSPGAFCRPRNWAGYEKTVAARRQP